MGTLCPELAKEGHLSLSLRKSPSSFIIKMVDNVETTTPTIEEVAAPVADNGEAEPAVTEEVKTTNGAADKTEEKEETTEEATKETTEETTEEATEEATKRKADAPSEEETVEKIAKLKETAAEVVAEAEQSLPKEPLTEAEATA